MSRFLEAPLLSRLRASAPKLGLVDGARWLDQGVRPLDPRIKNSDPLKTLKSRS